MRDLQYMIDVMTAASKGLRIEVRQRSSIQWELAIISDATSWDWRLFEWRIAPEPRKAREFWIVQYNDIQVATDYAVVKLATFDNPCNAESFSYQHAAEHMRTYFVREVLPEDNTILCADAKMRT